MIWSQGFLAWVGREAPERDFVNRYRLAEVPSLQMHILRKGDLAVLCMLEAYHAAQDFQDALEFLPHVLGYDAPENFRVLAEFIANPVE